MKHIILVFVCSVYLSIFSVCSAEYYEYTDEDGVKHFTENYADIPDEYKAGAQMEESIESTETEIETETETKPVQTTTEEDPQEPDAQVTLQGISALKQKLDAEHARIQKKIQDLTVENKPVDKKERTAKTIQLNAEIEAYNRRLAEYEAMVKEYNAKVKKLNQQQ